VGSRAGLDRQNPPPSAVFCVDIHIAGIQLSVLLQRIWWNSECTVCESAGNIPIYELKTGCQPEAEHAS
jgi:hypothetical protein